MRAAVIREHGGIEKVRVEDLPAPSIEAPDDVIVRVRACALNRLDLFVRQGLTGPGVRGVTLPHVSGCDVVGEVVDVGSAADGREVGDRVVVYPGIGCERCEFCRRGEDSMCQSYRIVGEDTRGGLAEYCRVSARNLEPLPGHVPVEKAAALPVAYTTAWRMLVTAGGLRPSERVLVLGAGGGVGSAAVVLARAIGAYAFAVSRGAERIERLKQIGADRPIDRDTEDVESVVIGETSGRGVDMIVNPVGGASFRPAIRSLAAGGRMLICGATIGDNPDISLREIYQRHRRIIGAPMGSRGDFRAVLDLLISGEIEPVIHAVYRLADIQEAHRVLDEGRAFGKVIVRPA